VAAILYLRGTADRLISEKSVETLVRSATSPVKIVRLTGPHLLLQLAPVEAWQAIGTFLDAS
jgi:hypothetical protein